MNGLVESAKEAVDLIYQDETMPVERRVELLDNVALYVDDLIRSLRKGETVG